MVTGVPLRRIPQGAFAVMYAALMTCVPAQTDFVVIGAGVAGLRAAIQLASAGQVLVLAKKEITESATQYAQGGIAAALSDEDEIGLHLQDTLSAGDGLCDAEAAAILVQEGPERIEELIAWGTEFDRLGTRLAFSREGAHSRNRILHAHGDSTGREIARALWEKTRSLKEVTVCEFEFTTGLWVEDGRVCGVELIDPQGDCRVLNACAVLLATGGMGHVYRDTTNPAVATGDGVAMAFRAGAEIGDMEFVQFHPTALYLKGAPHFLLSEALRGEGAYLRNSELDRFMPKYHPLAELAPRDVVARAIVHEVEASRPGDAAAYLDLTHLAGRKLDQRFPRIYATCLQYNIDISTDLIPIRPAAHYAMGGVRTDLHGHTSLNGLYAAGEVACTGVHGANRLASNSLLEGLVFGARAGLAMSDELVVTKAAGATARAPAETPAPPVAAPDLEDVIRRIQTLMWQDVGILRNANTLQRALKQLQRMCGELKGGRGRRSWEARNVLQAGLLIARAALAREESRGAHYRTDFPSRNDPKFRKHSIIRGEQIRFG
jgi:L-aspartate oxidase